MALVLIIVSVIYLIVVSFFNFIVNLTSAIPTARLLAVGEVEGWDSKSYKRRYRQYEIYIILRKIFQISGSILLVTLLTRYVYYLYDSHLIPIVLSVPITLGIINLWNQSRQGVISVSNEAAKGLFDLNDHYDMVRFELDKASERLYGYGSFWGIVIFLGYYLFPNIFHLVLECLLLDK